MPNLLGDFIRNIVIARRPEKRHLQAIEHAVRRIPLDVQLGFFNAIALYQIADIDHELRLQQIELADRDLKHDDASYDLDGFAAATLTLPTITANRIHVPADRR